MYQVSQISRPFTAVTVRFLKMSDSAMSMVAGRARDPEEDDVAAVPDDPERVLDRAAARRTSRRRRPTPIPSFCSTNQPGTSSTSSTFTTVVGAERPRRARSGKARGRTRAGGPRRRPCAIAIVKSPTGPQPSTATARPARSWVEVANTAFPNGSCRHAISGGSFARSFCQTTDDGIDDDSRRTRRRDRRRGSASARTCAPCPCGSGSTCRT